MEVEPVKRFWARHGYAIGIGLAFGCLLFTVGMVCAVVGDFMDLWDLPGEVGVTGGCYE